MGEVHYKGCIFHIHPQVYAPREDSFLLAENLHARKGGAVLEIGTGCGILAILAAKSDASVVATDINPHAVENAKENAELNGVSDKVELRQGYLFEPIKPEEKFDLIIFNPPYLPKEEEPEEWIDYSYSSSEVIKEFLEEYKDFLKQGGKCLLINSSISGVEVKGKIIAKKKLAFEELCVLEI